MGRIIFNGLSSEDYGIKVWQPPSYTIPERDYEIVHVPGRDGDIVLDKGSYKNTVRSYVVSFGEPDKENFVSLANGLSEWLHSCSGYARLEDSYEPEYYRLALYYETIDIVNAYNKAGQVTIKFNCKPQRFLKIGDNVIGFTSNGYLTNPTFFDSRPIIKIYCNGDGSVQIGEYVIVLKDIDEYIVIDSELMDAYKGTVNCNSKIELNGNFPRLIKGRNDISFSGGITSVEVRPKWWTI